MNKPGDFDKALRALAFKVGSDDGYKKRQPDVHAGGNARR